jgi:hypothetical protein
VTLAREGIIAQQPEFVAPAGQLSDTDPQLFADLFVGRTSLHWLVSALRA